MSDARKITIEILQPKSTGADDSSDQKSKKSSWDYKSLLDKCFHPINNIVRNLIDSSVDEGHKDYAEYAANQALSAVNSYLDYSMNRYFSLTEDYISQNEYQIFTKSRDMLHSGLSSMVTGMMAGSSLGPGGIVVGAVTGLASFGVQESIKQKQRFSSYYQQLNATNFNTSFNEQRASLYDGGRGTEN